MKYTSWKIDTDDNQICWLTFDRPDTSVNTINSEVLQELDHFLDHIPKNAKAVIIRSGKSKGFIAGADITQFTKIKSKKEALAFAKEAHDIFDKLEALTIPTVAMINGFCLGGGMELVLACDYRVAIDDPSARIGLPEVKLGLQPGWGGTVRMPRLIGHIPALTMIAAGRTYEPRKAKKLGIVDAVARTPHLLERAAVQYALTKPHKQQPSWWQRLPGWPLLRPFVASQFKKKLSSKIKPEHYPAPFTVVDCWQRDGAEGQQALKHEIEAIGNLFLSDTARNLIRVFFLQEQLKSASKKSDFNFNRVHVVGAGVMGGDIAAWCALQGAVVTIQDRDADYIAPGIKRAHDLFKKKLKQKRLVSAAMDRLIPDVSGVGVRSADIVIEAIYENLEAKQKLYQEIEPQLKEGAILATNTSSLMLEDLSTVLKNPERFVGVHFFNPVAKMMMVEVVQGKKTSKDTENKALCWVANLRKLPLPVKSSPAFLINRILMPYLIEAILLFQEGVPPAMIDKAATNFGMPMGPIELADTVGLDILAHAALVMKEHYDIELPRKLVDLVEDGDLGKKTGKGFYSYQKGKAVKVSLYQQGPNPDDLTDRMILPMINMGVTCLREKVVSEQDFVDAGMIFGAGWAPFRGGPMQYLESEGVDNIYERLQRLYENHGDRFKPDEGWLTLIKSSSQSKKSTPKKRDKNVGDGEDKSSSVTRKKNAKGDKHGTLD